MSSKKNVKFIIVSIFLLASLLLFWPLEIKDLLSTRKKQVNEPLQISHESSIVAQLIWNNVIKEMSIDERPIGIPAFIEGMRETINYPAAHFEVYFGNLKKGVEYFHLQKQLQDKLEKNEAIADFPYEKYQKLLQELAFFRGFKTWAHFKDDEQAILEEVISAINLLKDQNRSPTLHPLTRNQIDELHGRIYLKKKQQEVQAAENYFRKISGKPDVSEIKENRLYYQRLSAGSGKKIERDSLLSIRYRMETVYGHVMYDSKGSESVDLDRTMHGMQEGLMGLQEGEKGILFIHPEWTDLDLLSPPYIQSFLIMPFEIVSVF